jgi:GNAT superfamily N-acetyltransferase
MLRVADDVGLLDRSIATLLGYFELGNEVVVASGARFVRNLDCHEIYDANHGTAIRVETATEIDEVLRRADELFSGVEHRTYKVDPRTPSGFEGRLLLDGYTGSAELQLLLEGDLDARPPTIDIRTVESDADWETVARLTRLDHEEEAQKAGREPVSPVVTTQMVASKRAKAPDLTFFLAAVDGVDCGFFSSWPGANGVGKVEDLFTIPELRRRGVATALIAHAVGDARARGAGPVLIGADPDDSPKHMYAAMGFRPLCVLRSYTN